jgi:ELWxxDGT repeat protein
VLFQGFDASGHFGLWVTDGTPARTHELTDMDGAGASDFTVFNGEVLFVRANNSDIYGAIWVTNGTAAGTTLDETGAVGLDLTFFGPFFPGEVLFNESSDSALVATDGTVSGTHEVANISGGLFPFDMTVFEGEVLFNGRNGSGGNGLWVTTGTTEGTFELTGISGASPDIDPSDLTVFTFRTSTFRFVSEVLFNGIDDTGPGLVQRSLWVTDGTAAGTHKVFGISGTGSAALGLDPSNLTVLNGEVLFSGAEPNGSGRGLWVTNGTTAGTHELTGIAGRSSNGINPSALTAINGEVFFNGTDLNNKQSLWETDGTVAGTHELAIGGVGSGGLNPSDFKSVTFTIPPADDFNSDNNSDILFRSNSTGDTWYEAMNSGAAAGWFPIGGSNTSYGVIGTGDFGTGTDDILFRNNTTGDTWFEVMSNGVSDGWNQIGGSDTRYSATGVGDFDANGTSDILFRNNSTGDTWYEAMSSGAFASWNQIGGSDTSFSVVGLGDFNSDGADDILFRNNSTGDSWYEALNNGAFADWQQIGGSDTHYSVAGVGDFFGTGTDDILFRNNTTGDTWFVAISNGAFAGWNQIGGSDTNYAVVGVGDYFGNNTSDILFRNSAGDTWFEAISNGAFAGWNPIGGSNAAYGVPNVLGPPSLK